MTSPISPEILLRGYRSGIFPMAETRDADEVFWVDPRRRGVLPLDGFHISRSLARTMRRTDWILTEDQDFAGVLDGCADRADTWINDDIRTAYLTLHHGGHAHSQELREADGTLIGGVYGVAIGGAFFGESMFSRRTNASKIALACLVDRLRRGGFALFDTQFLTSHLASLGAQEITRAAYHTQLERALGRSASFSTPPTASIHEVMQRMTQTS